MLRQNSMTCDKNTPGHQLMMTAPTHGNGPKDIPVTLSKSCENNVTDVSAPDWLHCITLPHLSIACQQHWGKNKLTCKSSTTPCVHIFGCVMLERENYTELLFIFIAVTDQHPWCKPVNSITIQPV